MECIHVVLIVKSSHFSDRSGKGGASMMSMFLSCNFEILVVAVILFPSFCYRVRSYGCIPELQFDILPLLVLDNLI